MPIFEYVCSRCSKVFERVILSGHKEEIVCPSCGGKEAKKILSTFSLAGGGKALSPSCGGCIPNPSKCSSCR